MTDPEHMTDEERADDITHLIDHIYYQRRDCHHARELRELLGHAIDHIQHYRQKAEAKATDNPDLIAFAAYITEHCRHLPDDATIPIDLGTARAIAAKLEGR